jgi:hypothetical protein
MKIILKNGEKVKFRLILRAGARKIIKVLTNQKNINENLLFELFICFLMCDYGIF